MHRTHLFARRIMLLILGGWAVLGLSSPSMAATPARSQPDLPALAQTAHVASPTSPGQLAADVIQITENGLLPDNLSVSVGADVVWENTTSQLQTIQSGAPVALFLPSIQTGSGGQQQANVRYSPLLPQTDFRGDLQPGARFTVTFAVEGSYPYYLASRPHLRGQITVTPDFQPALEDVAPPLDLGTPTDLATSTSFLYSGTDPVQTGVLSGAIQSERVAVLRGRVLDQSQTPLAGVTISIVDHPEYGQTRSRSDGYFDLAVNGGAPYRVAYSLPGSMPVQRMIQPPQGDFFWLPDVSLLAYDSRVTTIDLTETDQHQVAQGSPITDTDGSRQATLLFSPGTQAKMVVKRNGRTVLQPLSTINVRATEYTVGDAGPAAMPAFLPAQSGYTYAVELSVDEAIAAGASEVTFDQPVAFYVENFLNFPVGGIVPSGYYDRERGEWVAVPNGRVIKLLSVSNGMANLDISGNNGANSDLELAELGVTSGEREKLAALYQPGQSLWRIPITHFTPWDHNWPYGPPIDAATFLELCQAEGGSESDCTEELEKLLDDPCHSGGSIIECENQTLRESVTIAGTTYSLNYASDRMAGRTDRRTLTIPLSVSGVPDSLKRMDLEIRVAGQKIERTFSGAPNQRYTFVWNGKDAYGRTLQGAVPVNIRVGYTYDAVYKEPDEFAQSFARFSGSGADIEGSRQRGEVTLWSAWMEEVTQWDARGIGLGGWTLSPHHLYDPMGRILYRGDGTRRSAEALPDIIETVAGTGAKGFGGDGGPATEAVIFRPTDLAFGPDGHLYFADLNNSRIRKIDGFGVITTVAGNGIRDLVNIGDGGSALDASVMDPSGIAFGADGSFYVASGYRVRKIDSSGVITTVAGVGTFGFSGDGGPATEAMIVASRLAIGPDGSLYVSESIRHTVRRIGPDGIISTVAGRSSNTGGFGGDGGLATQARLDTPFGMDVGPDGSLYIADRENGRIRKISPDGIITTVAGNGECCFGGDGSLATLATLGRPSDVAVMADGGFYIAGFTGKYAGWVRYVSPDGIIRSVAGNGEYGGGGDKGAATSASLAAASAVSVGPDGNLIIADGSDNRLRRVRPIFSGFANTNFTIASADGAEIFEFNPFGRHLRTVDALTGITRQEFTYDDAGYLSRIQDENGLLTTVERDEAGNPLAIIGPYGHRTQLTTDANRFIIQILDPAAQQLHFGYDAGGLLTSFTNPRGQESVMSYDGSGRLLSDQDGAGGGTTLSRTEEGNGYLVSRTSALGRTTTYSVTQQATGAQQRVVTQPSGAESHSSTQTDGAQTTHFADGMVTTLELGPDPRFGMQVPLARRLTLVSPGGITATLEVQRSVVLTDPTDLLSVQTLTDVVIRNGRSFTSIYDAATRTTIETTPEGRQITTQLDAAGRVIQSQMTGLLPTLLEYDANGRVVKSQIGDPGNQRTTTFTYNSQGAPASILDPVGNLFGFSYDPVGRVTEQTLPDSRTIAYTFDANGNLSGLTPPGRSAHTFAYSPVDLESTYTPPGSTPQTGPIQITYNVDRQPTQILRPDGQALLFSYDAGGRLTTMETADGPYGYGYHTPGGQLASLISPQGITLTLTYDGAALTSQRWAGPVAGEVAYGYNTDFRPVEQWVNGQFTVSLGYDRDGLLVQAGQLQLVRDAGHGLVTEIQLQNLTETLTYNGFADLVSYESRFGPETVRSVAYQHNGLGQITGVTETIGLTTEVTHYAYAATGALTQVRRNGVVAATYTYDENGNRLSAVDATGTMTATVDQLDRLLRYGDLQLAYNANGELIEKRAGAQTTSFGYDGLGNLVTVTLADGSQITYLLDGLGRRVGKSVDGQLTQGFLYRSGKDPAATSAAGYLAANLAPVAELDATGNVVSLFVYGSRGHVPDYMVRGGKSYRLISDHLGSVRMVVDTTSGAVVQEMAYDAFGQILRDTNPGFQPFGFAGGLIDHHTGLTHFGAREYDAFLGRWITPDPILFAGGDTNLYAYVLNNPVNWIDPSGLAWYDHFGWLEPISDFSAGFGDTISTIPFTDFSISRSLRKGLDVDDVVNKCSGAFRFGQVSGVAYGLVKGAAQVNNLYKWYKAPLYRQSPIPTVPNYYPGVRNIPSRTLYGYPASGGN